MIENSLPGSANWNLRIRSTQHEIEGYGLTQSAVPGEPVPIAVSVSPGPAQFTWIVYRIGDYAGAGAREILRGGPVAATAQPACPADPSTGLIACGWKPAFTLQTSGAWPTGLYLVRLVRGDGWETWVPLILRSPRPAPQVLMIVPTATWQAYNPFGGESLYVDANGYTKSGRAFQVSYDRPYGMGFGAGDLLRWDQHVARWLEANGEDVAYATDEDVDRDPSLLSQVKVIVLSAHDEYWSGAQRAAIDGAVASGTSLLLFGANAAYWQIRYAPSRDGRDRRIITCYKEDASRLDPVGASSPDLTTQFRKAPVSRPESALFGIMFKDWNTFGFPLTVTDPTHWALAGTGLVAGDTIPLIGGYEVDAHSDTGATPPGVEVIAEAPFLGIYGGLTRGQMVVRQQGDAIVFAAGGVDFAAALDGDRGDARAQRIALNVLTRALGNPAPSGAAVAGTTSPALGPFALRVSTIAGVALVPGSDDGPPGTGRLRQPVAVAPLPGGSLAVLDMGDRVIRRVDASGILSTIPSPSLTMPLGLAADVAGNLYVSDVSQGCIWSIDTAGTATVLAGLPGSLGATDGTTATARFMAPAGLSLLGKALYVADIGANAVRKIDLTAKTVTTIAPAVQEPTGVAVAPDGTIYAVETAYQRVVALSGGQLRKIAGDVAGFTDGSADSARLLPYLGLAVLPDGALAISDPGNYRVRLYRGGQVTTLAGSGRFGGRDGTGDQADLVLPAGLAVDSAGHLLVADVGTSTVRRIIR